MYRTSVPVMIRPDFDKEGTLAALRRSGADTVFLTLTRKTEYRFSPEEDLAMVRELIPYYEAAGFTVGIWIGESMGHDWGTAAPYTPLVLQDGTPLHAAYCPLDENFSHDICRWIGKIASLGAKLLLIDDDFRLTRGTYGMTCFCERHCRAFAEMCGMTTLPTAVEVRDLVYTGKANRYRDAWLTLSGDTLRDFARKIRAAVDAVDPKITVGFCGCLSTWDLDGVESAELAKIFAGEGNRPFLRLIGAPYWIAMNPPDRKFHDVIDFERMQAHHVRDLGMTVFSEGDTYPRPRYAVPASYLEGFDTLLHADGNLDGIHKYTIDYYASPAYESGYYRAAEENRPTHAAIERLFGGKRAVGIRHPAVMHTLRDAELPATFETPGYGMNDGACFVSSCSLPLTFEEDGGDCPYVVFGEEARHVSPDLLKNGAIINLTAAKILEERGIDTGLQSVGDPLLLPTERFFESGESVFLFGGTKWRTVPKAGATVESEFVDSDGTRTSGTFSYTNAEGMSFLVLPFTVKRVGDRREESVIGIYESYERQKQVAAFAARLGRPVPAACPGVPDLYLLCKDGGGRRAVGLWNFFADAAHAPHVTLSKTPKRITDTVNCTAALDGDTVVLSDVPPHAMAAFEVEF